VLPHWLGVKEAIAMDRRYTSLRVIGTIFKILAWISLILGLISAVGLLIVGFTLSGEPGLLGVSLSGPLAGVAMFVAFVIIAVFSFLTLYAIGESIYLFLSIEENTRRAAILAQQQYTSYQAPFVSPPAQSDVED
jgi:hypothetical protein